MVQRTPHLSNSQDSIPDTLESDIAFLQETIRIRDEDKPDEQMWLRRLQRCAQIRIAYDTRLNKRYTGLAAMAQNPRALLGKLKNESGSSMALVLSNSLQDCIDDLMSLRPRQNVVEERINYQQTSMSDVLGHAKPK